MSRSRMKHPHHSITCRGGRAGAEKSYKVAAHRGLRRAVRVALHVGNLDDLPDDRQFGDPWCGPKDGKWRIRDTVKWAKYCRK